MRNWYYRTFKVKAIYANPEIAKGYELRTSPADWWDFDGAATIAPGTMSGVRLAIRYDDITTYHEVWMGDTVQARRRVTPEPKTYTAAQVVEGAAAGAIITVRPTFARPFKIGCRDTDNEWLQHSPDASGKWVSLHGVKLNMDGQPWQGSRAGRLGRHRQFRMPVSEIADVTIPAEQR